jgi:methionyl-tRNA formyltransferase
MNKKLRIIFMGTPEFAVPSLDILVKNGYNVVAVVTAPDKPAGRGLKLSSSPVKDYAVANNIPVLQPEKLKNPDFLEELKSYKADLQVIVAFRMLPEAVWNMPPIGSFNLHASLLPQYRGAAPINWAIINGEKETGVTTFFLKHEIDTGDILFQEKELINIDDNAGTLYKRLMHRGAGLVLKTVQAIEAGDYTPQPQVFEKETKSAPKIFKDTCKINWQQDADSIYNFIRGLSPYPAAWTELQGKSCKILKAKKFISSSVANNPGAIHTDNKTFLHMESSNGLIAIEELQMEGKKKMSVEEFLRGHKL